jgi:CHAT domain-containing protein/Tfp pilus assembly protein PilF
MHLPWSRLLLLTLTLPGIASADQATAALEPGVQIEQVKRLSASHQAGMQTGDFVFAWSAAAEKGNIGSTFDLTEVEMEYAARGPVTLRGRRGALEQSWTLKTGLPGSWGITAHPLLSPALLESYREGQKLAKAGQTGEALTRWRNAAAEAAQSSVLSAVWLLSEAGSDLADARKWAEADELTRQALEQAAGAEPVVRAQIVESWAKTFYTRDWARAEALYSQSLQERRKGKAESLAIAFIINSLGFVIRNQGRLVPAEEQYRSALGIAERLAPGSIAVASFLNNMGAVAQYRGELVRAEEYYLRGLAIRQKVLPESVSSVWNNLGAVAFDEGNLDKADTYWRNALTLLEKSAPGSPLMARVLHNIAQVAQARGDFATAEEFYRRTSDVVAKLDPGGLDFAESLDWVGRMAFRRGDLARAEDAQRQALAIRQKLDPAGLSTAESLASLGILAAARKDAATAEEYQREALQIREKLAPGSKDHADSLLSVAALLRVKGQFAGSAELVGNALDMMERNISGLDGTEENRVDRRAMYAASYREYVELLLLDKQPERAFAAWERSRARSLLSMIAERDLTLSSDLPADLKQARSLNDRAYDRVQNQINGLPANAGPQRAALLARLTGLAGERERIAERIRRASPRLAGLQYPQPLDLNGTRQVLDAGTVLLSYSAGPTQTVLFVVQPAGVDPGLTVFTLPIGDKELQAKVQEFRRLIEHGSVANRTALNAGGRALYDLLIKPAEALLAENNRVLIVPDGALHVLPFAALLRSDGQYLAEWKPLHEVVSATVYAEVKKMRHPPAAAGTELLAFGDPRTTAERKQQQPQPASLELRSALQSVSSLSSLPFSREEVAGIATLYPRRSETYVGADATEARAKTLSPRARYIHFATHALLDETVPLNSAIVLHIPDQWSEGQENGLLQAWEIFEQVRLNADLVVLSGCETGLGTEDKGEGLIGLTRAFQYAGARSVLASLWSVDDRKTAELMRSFYRYLQNGKSKDEALRAAQLELIHRNASNPYYWAGFSLFGDWQ